MILRASAPKPKGYPENPTTLALKFKKKRMDLGLTAREVCYEIEIDPKQLWRWEHGIREPKGNNREKMIRWLRD